MRKIKLEMYVKLCKAGIFYNDHEKFDWAESNFPDPQYFGIKAHTEFIWELKQVRYNNESQILTVEPLDYSPSDTGPFHSQSPKLSVKRIVFQNILWEELEPLFYRYKRSAFVEGLVKKPDSSSRKRDTSGKTTDGPAPFFMREVRENRDEYGNEGEQSLSPKKQKVSKTYRVKLKDLQFKNGYVEYYAHVFEYVHNTIRIYNDHILEEFDHIKPYFSKIIGKKEVLIEGYFILDGLDVLEKHFYSKDLDVINEDSYTTIKIIIIRETPNRPPLQGAIDKNLFTNEDLLDETHGEKIGNVLKTTELEILEQLMGKANVRNRKQLSYLAGKIHQPEIKLRFTLKPDFGFVFCHKGRRMVHFIWELLDSNATYVWSSDYDRSEEQLLEDIEDIIGFIQNQGRKTYLQSAKNDRFVFHRIIHRTKGLVDSFPRWKQELNAGLI